MDNDQKSIEELSYKVLSLEQEVFYLKQALEQTRKDRDTYIIKYREVETLEDTILSLRQELDIVNGNRDTYRIAYNAAMIEANTLYEKCQELTKKLEVEKGWVEQYRNAWMKSPTSEENTTLQDLVNTYRATIEDNRVEIERLEEQVRTLRELREFDRVKMEDDRIEIAALKNQLRTCSDTLRWKD